MDWIYENWLTQGDQSGAGSSLRGVIQRTAGCAHAEISDCRKPVPQRSQQIFPGKTVGWSLKFTTLRVLINQMDVNVDQPKKARRDR